MEDCVPRIFFWLIMVQNLNRELSSWSAPFHFHLLSIPMVLFFHSEDMTPFKLCPHFTAVQGLLRLDLGAIT